MFLTKRQKAILEAQTPIGRYHGSPNKTIGVTMSSIHATNTLIFKNAVGALEVLSNPDYKKIWETRLRTNKEEIWELTKRLRAILKDL